MTLTGCFTSNKTNSSSQTESSSEASSTSSESSSEVVSSSEVISSSEESSESSESSSEEESKELRLVQDDPYSLGANYRNMRIKGSGYAGEQFTEHSRYNAELNKKEYCYAVEEVRALVIPVDFTDYTYEVYGETEDDSREELRKIMFGSRDETAWYSLSEYYKESSFGKCNVSGDVGPWWHTGLKSTDVPKNSKGKPDTEYARTIAINIQDYYRIHYDEINLAQYDANKDGLVDALLLVYSAPITTTGELWWAFCWSVSGAFGKYTEKGNLEGVNRFFWASFGFFYEKGYDDKGRTIYYTSEEIKNGTAVADSHTIIHEFGHVLSLPDYYVTDYAAGDYEGLGGLDMMDHNIGDHNAFSKMMYGWINPYRVAGSEGSVTQTIRSTTTTGDCIIVPAVDSWNNTYLDQYLVIEFLTPEGVAELDGKVQLLGQYPLYYSIAGVRITQVDARMGVYSSGSGGYEFTGYTYATTPPDSRSYVTFAASNTASDSAYDKFKLIEVLPATGKTMKALAGRATDACLYQEGDVFGEGTIFPSFKMNDTNGGKTKEFGFKISIDQIVGNESATITITRA